MEGLDLEELQEAEATMDEDAMHEELIAHREQIAALREQLRMTRTLIAGAGAVLQAIAITVGSIGADEPGGDSSIAEAFTTFLASVEKSAKAG